MGRALPSACTVPLLIICVSILARPVGRALRFIDVLFSWYEDVSILARPVGRALLEEAKYDRKMALIDVSILARPVGRALPKFPLKKGGAKEFQSSPVLWDGRYLRFLRENDLLCCFNPRPSCGTGATQPLGCRVKPLGVSILARPVGRALPMIQVRRSTPALFQSSPVLWDGRYRVRLARCQRLAEFQSSPVLWDGRYPYRRRHCIALRVSILARPVGRALRFLTDDDGNNQWGFNPRPSCGTGAT